MKALAFIATGLFLLLAAQSAGEPVPLAIEAAPASAPCSANPCLTVDCGRPPLPKGPLEPADAFRDQRSFS